MTKEPQPLTDNSFDVNAATCALDRAVLVASLLRERGELDERNARRLAEKPWNHMDEITKCVRDERERWER